MNAFAAAKSELADAFEDGVDRFQHGSLDERCGHRDLDDARHAKVGHAHIPGITAPGRFKPCGDAGLFVLEALGVGVMPAIVALAAGNVVVKSDAVADLKATDAPAQSDDRPRGFMAKDPGRRHGTSLDLLDVSRANPANGDLDQNLAGFDRRDGNFLDPDVILAAVDGRLHEFWDGRCFHAWQGY